MKRNTIKEIIRIFKCHGELKYGESISVNSHSVQAALHAIDKGYTREIVIAALLHDIGHLVPLDQPDREWEVMDQFGIAAHETIGADFLRALSIPESICQPIALHVETKRYLCAVDSSYYDLLSTASKATLKHQGGKMSGVEVAKFRDLPYYDAAIKVRLLDDSAKDPDFIVTESYWDYFGQLMAGPISIKETKNQ